MYVMGEENMIIVGRFHNTANGGSRERERERVWKGMFICAVSTRQCLSTHTPWYSTLILNYCNMLLVSTASHCTKTKLKYLGFWFCHLVPVTSFGACTVVIVEWSHAIENPVNTRAWPIAIQFHPVYIASNDYLKKKSYQKQRLNIHQCDNNENETILACTFTF